MYHPIDFAEVHKLLDETKHRLKDFRYIVAAIGVVTAVVLISFIFALIRTKCNKKQKTDSRTHSIESIDATAPPWEGSLKRNP